MNKYTEMTLIGVLSVYLIGCGNSEYQIKTCEGE